MIDGWLPGEETAPGGGLLRGAAALIRRNLPHSRYSHRGSSFAGRRPAMSAFSRIQNQLAAGTFRLLAAGALLVASNAVAAGARAPTVTAITVAPAEATLAGPRA